MKTDTYRVPMPPHGLIFGGIEAFHLQDAFGSAPGPPGPQKNGQNRKKVVKNIAFPKFPLTGTPLKGAVCMYKCTSFVNPLHISKLRAEVYLESHLKRDTSARLLRMRGGY